MSSARRGIIRAGVRLNIKELRSRSRKRRRIKSESVSYTRTIFVKIYNMTTQDQIKLFFKTPSDFADTDRANGNSSLYLLRRDIDMSFGINPNNGERLEHSILLPGVMCIMAGIDLMAKFLLGNTGKVGDRFVAFCNKYISGTNSQLLWLLRNSLMHSFGLYIKRGEREYRFILTRFDDPNTLFAVDNDGHYWVSIDQLKAAFDRSVTLFHNDVVSNKTDRRLFSEMFEIYGIMGKQKLK